MSAQVSSSSTIRPAAVQSWRRVTPFVLGGLLFLLPLLSAPRLRPEAAGARWSPVGLQGQTVRELRVVGGVGLSAGVVYARTETGLWRSTDGGRSWAEAHVGLPVGTWGQPVIEHWAVAAGSPYALYVVATVEGERRLFFSTNGGGRWARVLTADALPGPVLAMTATSDDRLYLATPARLYRSTDGGRTWQAGGFWPAKAHPWRMAVGAGGVLYAAAREAGLWASRDEGESWQALLAADVAAWDHAGDRHYVAGKHGAFRSDDAGRTWRALPLAAAQVTAFAVNPATPLVVYAMLAQGKALVSEDAGETWREMSEGLAGQMMLALAIDPTGGGGLYAASGDGVWRRAVTPPPYPTATATPTTATLANTPTLSLAEVATGAPPGPSPVAEAGPALATDTATPTPSATPTATATPTPSPTRRRPTPLPTPTPPVRPTPEPSLAAPSPTPMPPAVTLAPPTATSVPPTPTPVPPTATPAPPTPTPDRVLPTPTALPPPPPR